MDDDRSLETDIKKNRDKKTHKRQNRVRGGRKRGVEMSEVECF